MNPKIWTPRYLKNRTLLFLHEKMHRADPWIAPAAVRTLDKLLTKEMRGLEFGSGRSTVWYAKRLKHITSVEDHKGWFKEVSHKIKKSGIDTIDYRFCSSEGNTPEETAYYRVMDSFDDNSLDIIIVDGKLRGALALKSIVKIKPRGLILIDDVERYLPRATHSPFKIYGKNVALTPEWESFKRKTEGWEYLHFTSGVSDTGIFIKPT